MLLHDISDIDSDARKFTFGAKAFDVNDPDPRKNVVWALGYNMKPGNGKLDLDDTALGLVFETYYVAYGPGGLPTNEFHLSAWDTSNHEHRFISALLPRDGGDGARLALRSDNITFEMYDNTLKLQYIFAHNGSQASHIGGFVYIFNTNNYAIHRQRNADNTSWLDLPYIDNNDNLRINTNIYVPYFTANRHVLTDSDKNLITGPAGFSGNIDVGGTILTVDNGIITAVS